MCCVRLWPAQVYKLYTYARLNSVNTVRRSETGTQNQKLYSVNAARERPTSSRVKLQPARRAISTNVLPHSRLHHPHADKSLL